VLVLDGLAGQLDRTTLDGLALLVERAGDTLRLVITTRSDPPLPLARWRTRGWLNDVREDELRLTDDEALAIAAVADTAIRDTDAVIALNQRVDGWPIGLHMALLARRADDTRSAGALVGGPDRLLADYLVVELLEALTDAERDVALSLSVLEWFDPDLCAELLGSDAAVVVRQLLGRGTFLSVVDPRIGAMRFHDPFRELMEMELGYRDPARRLDLHRRAALAWRARGDLMSAYRHLAVIGEAARAHDLLVGPALELVDQGDLDALHRFARQLPTPHDVTIASLAVDLGVVAYYAEGTLAAGAWCDRAATLLDAGVAAGVSDVRTEARRHGLRCAIALLEADLDAAVTGVAEHRAITRHLDAVDDFESRFPIVAARVMLGARRMTEAAEWIERAERLAGPDIVTMVTVPTLRSWYEWMFGRLDRAVEIIDDAARWMTDHRVGAHHLAFDTLITAGWCRLSIGDLPDAIRFAERAATDAHTLGTAWNQLQAGFLAARLAVVTGDPVRALQVVDDLRTVVALDTCRPYADRLLGVEVEALAACGRAVEAVRLIAGLQPGPRAALLEARFHHRPGAEVEALLADRHTWPTLERWQAEVVLHTRHHGAAPSDELVELVAECGRAGWALPFLGLGPRVERLLQAIRLDEVHPGLARALTYLAPTSPVSATERGVRLTSRELTLVELLPTHLSYAEMGERLFLSVNTVKSNLKALYRKLDATTRAEAVEASRRAGLL
jgi:LuxR family maltose regulon positive regulatory protein